MLMQPTDDFDDLVDPYQELQTVDLGKFEYLQDVQMNITNLDTKNFNHLIFEEDMDNMPEAEFEEFFNTIFPTWVDSMKNYIFIDLDLLVNESWRARLTFVKNIVRFYMVSLPYNYLKNYLIQSNVEGLHDALDLVARPGLLQELINQIELTKQQQQNFNSIMNDLNDSITNDKKREKFNESLTLLNQNMDNKYKLQDYFISVINDSSEVELSELCSNYIRMDKENIIG